MEHFNKLLNFFLFYVFKRNLEIFDDIRHSHKVNRNQALLVIEIFAVLLGSLVINFATPEVLSWIAKIFEQALNLHNTVFMPILSQSTVVMLDAWTGLTLGKQGLRQYYKYHYGVSNSDYIFSPAEINTISIDLYVYVKVNKIDFILDNIGAQDPKLFMDELTKKYLSKIIEEIDKTERLNYGSKDSQEKAQLAANKTKLKGIILAMRPPDCQFDKLFKWIKLAQVDLDIKREKVKQALQIEKDIKDNPIAIGNNFNGQAPTPNMLNQFPQTARLASLATNPITGSPNYGSMTNPIDAGQGTKILIQEKILQKSIELASSIPALIEQKNVCKEILSDINVKFFSPLSPS